VQDDVAGPMLEMLRGASDELILGDPMELATDIAPIIDR
jgi:RHH-type proline utilization regulon transcriptional repressor/proline dehydrogenase/delta 1-pyrroline-5-carboxylate dehydrogenase